MENEWIEPMIKAENLSKSFGSRILWSRIDISVEAGEMLALTGPSGSGKSTLLNCFGLLDTPSSGAIYYAGKDITKFSTTKKRIFRRDVVGYLFQNYALIENATAAANLEVVTKPRLGLRRSSRTAIADALDRVGLADRANEKVYHLSGGEQQRVALARLLVKRPKLILADEPTGALDHSNAVIVVDLLNEMRDSGCAIIIATHNDYVRDRCDTVFSIGNTKSITQKSEPVAT